MTPRDYARLFAQMNARQMRRDKRQAVAEWLLIAALAFSAAVMVAVGVFA